MNSSFFSNIFAQSKSVADVMSLLRASLGIETTGVDSTKNDDSENLFDWDYISTPTDTVSLGQVKIRGEKIKLAEFQEIAAEFNNIDDLLNSLNTFEKGTDKYGNTVYNVYSAVGKLLASVTSNTISTDCEEGKTYEQKICTKYGSGSTKASEQTVSIDKETGEKTITTKIYQNDIVVSNRVETYDSTGMLQNAIDYEYKSGIITSRKESTVTENSNGKLVTMLTYTYGANSAGFVLETLTSKELNQYNDKENLFTVTIIKYSETGKVAEEHLGNYSYELGALHSGYRKLYDESGNLTYEGACELPSYTTIGEAGAPSFRYDSQGRVIYSKTIDVSPGGTVYVAQEVNYTYNADGSYTKTTRQYKVPESDSLIEYKDAIEKYNKDDKLVSRKLIWTEADKTTVVTYDVATGKPVSTVVTSADGGVTSKSVTYDSQGRVIAEETTNPSSKTVYAYNSDGSYGRIYTLYEEKGIKVGTITERYDRNGYLTSSTDTLEPSKTVGKYNIDGTYTSTKTILDADGKTIKTITERLDRHGRMVYYKDSSTQISITYWTDGSRTTAQSYYDANGKVEYKITEKIDYKGRTLLYEDSRELSRTTYRYNVDGSYQKTEIELDVKGSEVSRTTTKYDKDGNVVIVLPFEERKQVLLKELDALNEQAKAAAEAYAAVISNRTLMFNDEILQYSDLAAVDDTTNSIRIVNSKGQIVVSSLLDDPTIHQMLWVDTIDSNGDPISVQIADIDKNGKIVQTNAGLKYGFVSPDLGKTVVVSKALLTDNAQFQEALLNGSLLMQQSAELDYAAPRTWTSFDWQSHESFIDTLYKDDDAVATAVYEAIMSQIRAQELKIQLELDYIENCQQAVNLGGGGLTSLKGTLSASTDISKVVELELSLQAFAQQKIDLTKQAETAAKELVDALTNEIMTFNWNMDQNGNQISQVLTYSALSGTTTGNAIPARIINSKGEIIVSGADDPVLRKMLFVDTVDKDGNPISVQIAEIDATTGKLVQTTAGKTYGFVSPDLGKKIVVNQELLEDTTAFQNALQSGKLFIQTGTRTTQTNTEDCDETVTEPYKWKLFDWKNSDAFNVKLDLSDDALAVSDYETKMAQITAKSKKLDIDIAKTKADLVALTPAEAKPCDTTYQTTYDKNGNPTVSFYNPNGAKIATMTYTKDANYNLISAVYTTYDENGNPTVKTYTYDPEYGVYAISTEV